MAAAIRIGTASGVGASRGATSSNSKRSGGTRAPRREAGGWRACINDSDTSLKFHAA
jgi:hypothetical protein